MRKLLSKRRSPASVKGRFKERGAELVELTLVFPLLIFLSMGMLDAGMAFKSKMEVAQATRQGARVGSAVGTDATADDQALLALTSVIPEYLNIDAADTTSPRLDFVVIYKADINGEMAAGCESGDVAGQCNYMSRADVEAALAAIAGGASPVETVAWSRSNDISSLDDVGVFVQATRPSFTGAFEGLGNWTVTGKTVMRVEPAQ